VGALLRLLILVLALAGSLAGGDPKLDRAHALRADLVRLQKSRPKAALSAGLEALDLARAASDTALEVSLVEPLARHFIANGDLRSVSELLDRGEGLLKGQSDPSRTHRFRYLRALVLLREGNPREAIRMAEGVLPMARKLRDSELTLDLLLLMGESYAGLGDFQSGIQHLHEGKSLAEQSRDPVGKLAAQSALGTFYIREQDWPRAMEANEEATRLARAQGDLVRLAPLRNNAALCLSHLNRPEEEYAALLEAETLCRELENDRVRMAVEVNLSDFLLRRGDHRGALAWADQGLAIARKLGPREAEGASLLARGQALLRLGHRKEGLSAMGEGLGIYRELGVQGGVAEALGSLSEEYARLGDFQRALALHRDFKQISDTLHQAANAKSLQDLDSRLQSERQARQITQLQGEASRKSLARNFSVLVAVLALALVVVLAARYRLLRRNAAQLAELNGRLEVAAVTDPLTGLPNRRSFLQHVEADVAQADRAHASEDPEPSGAWNPDLIFYLVDLDHFKHVNDTYGHHAGDRVLQQAAERLKGAIRGSDLLIRWGGEEFLLVARRSNREEGEILAERMRAAVASAPFDLGEGRSLARTCSIGFAPYPLFVGRPGRPGWETVVDLADQALYRAKASGRNGWVGLGGSLTREGREAEWTAGMDLQALVDQGHCPLVQAFHGTPGSEA